MTFAQMADKAARAAAGLRELGVGKGDRVVLMMRNIPEFHYLDLAVMLLGATPVSIYNSSSADQVSYLAGHCGAKVAIVENEGFLDKFLEVRDQLPNLSAIVTIVDPSELPDGVHGRHVLSDAEPIDIHDAAKNAEPDDLATIIYTSGTTGNPKGVMLSHYNIVWTLEAVPAGLRLDPGGAGRQEGRVLPADGPHRRADGVALHAARCRDRGVDLSRDLDAHHVPR